MFRSLYVVTGIMRGYQAETQQNIILAVSYGFKSASGYMLTVRLGTGGGQTDKLVSVDLRS